jgi:hypothetical protein
MAQLKIDKLIEYAYLREECDLPSTIRDEMLEHKIYRAQEVLRMLFGDAFYQDYLTNYKAETFSTAYTTIYPYVKQFIAWQANQYWTLKANFMEHASGFRVHSEPNSVAASDQQMAILIKDAKYQADYYKRLLVDYLNAHHADYPLYEYSCGKGVTGNGFHISAVKNKGKCEPHYRRRKCCD